MFTLKRKGRLNFLRLAPLMRTWPGRCARSGETEKYQTPYPPPWLSISKANVIPRLYPLEIDHINSLETDNRPANLRWLTKLHHIEKSAETIVFKKQRRGATNVLLFPKPIVTPEKIKQKILCPSLF